MFPPSNNIFFLSPVFVSPDDDANTLSTRAMNKSGYFDNVTEIIHKSLTFTTRDGSPHSIPFIQRNTLDYVNAVILSTSAVTSTAKYQASKLSLSSPPKVCRLSNSNPRAPEVLSLYLHMKYGHRSIKSIQQMIDAGIVVIPSGFGKKLTELSSPCPICVIGGATKIPRGPIVDTTELPVGTRFHIDYSFYSVTSIRGFKALLTITDATTSREWRFPTKSKRPPLAIVAHFVRTIRRANYPCTRIRVDEGGELARSESFMAMCFDKLEVTVESTGGYNSTANGKVEGGHRPAKISVRCMLLTAGRTDNFWCFATTHQCVLKNHMLHSRTKKVPELHFNPKSTIIPTESFPIWGSKLFIIKDSPNNIEPRTLTDPRNPIPRLHRNESRSSQPLKTHDGYFMGFANHYSNAIVFKPPNQIKRVHHLRVDEFGSTLKPEKMTPGEFLLRNHPFINPSSEEEFKSLVPESNLSCIETLIDKSKCKNLSVQLPPKSVADLGLIFEFDVSVGMPALVDMTPDSPLLPFIPLHYIKKRHYVESIDGYEPITEDDVISKLGALQTAGRRTIKISLLEADKDSPASNYELYRNYHDCVNHQVRHLVQQPTKPEHSKSMFDNIKGRHRKEWKEAAFKAYDKMQRLSIYSRPIPFQDLPKGTKVLNSVLATKVKQVALDLWELCVRHCADGSKQKRGEDFDYSFSPTASAGAVKGSISLAALHRLELALLDVENCFQTMLVPVDQRIVMTAPMFWLDWFKSRYPNCKIDPSSNGKYYVQAFNGVQGMKSIGRIWYKFMYVMLTKFGFSRFHGDHALFLYYDKSTGEMMILDTSTDDFLCGHNSHTLLKSLIDHISKYVNVTVQQGELLNYLNLRIIQSSYGISIDQTQHIKDTILDVWFPQDDEKSSVKAAYTPFSTDPKYERKLVDTLPAQESELAQLEYEYKGTFPHLIGKVSHVAVWTRPDLCYSMSRLQKLATVPHRPAFEGIKRVGRYLYYNPHRPIMFPRKASLTGVHILRNTYDNGRTEEAEIVNNIAIFVDSEHGRDLSTRRSTYFVCVVIAGVIVDHIAKQSGAIALHSTDAEIYGFCAASKRATFWYDLAVFFQLPTAGQPITIYEDSKPCIDVVQSHSISSKVKHLLAVQIAFAYEKITMGITQPEYLHTTLQPADAGTKPQSAPVIERAFNYLIGVRHYPPPISDHAKVLELSEFKCYHDKASMAIELDDEEKKDD